MVLRSLGLGILLRWMLGLASCQETPQLNNFDSAQWKKDKFACAGLRQALLPQFEKNREKLMGLGQNQILTLLGKPDFAELYQRGQRYYFYYYKKSNVCQGEKPDPLAGPWIRVRFDALDRVSEIIINP
ncbi:MAG: hypothetical protein OHK0053_04060 [Microscillaceae bacterium]